jgi:UDP-N-acetylglucosamine diphosphorylase / glucose-1-phosphate thymidylyltransferase / UDP-N-acetylgalactosamine diphosphorylase / glucosamine-1-phosphate N-acetyltransferase / galactosamine-1-phosphate N-acetyltransferase
MQAVILCAGKGTRMGELTRDLPKPLLSISNKTLLEHKLERLPDVVTEIILIVGYLGDKIREKIGNEFKGKPVHYIEDTCLTGTAHALWQAKDMLKGRFLVMMGDDIYDTKTLEACAQHDFSLACVALDRETTGSRILIENGRLTGFVTHKHYLTLRPDGGQVFTGLYSLTTDIFNYEPVKLELKDEWGLPQTLLVAAKDHPVTIVETNFWISINSPEDLLKAEKQLEN